MYKGGVVCVGDEKSGETDTCKGILLFGTSLYRGGGGNYNKKYLLVKEYNKCYKTNNKFFTCSLSEQKQCFVFFLRNLFTISLYGFYLTKDYYFAQSDNGFEITETFWVKKLVLVLIRSKLVHVKFSES